MKNRIVKRVIALAVMTTSTASLIGCGGLTKTTGTEYVTDDDLTEEETVTTISALDIAEPSFEESDIEALEDSTSTTTTLFAAQSATEDTQVEESKDEADSTDDDDDDTITIVFLGDSQFANGREAGTSIADYVEASVSGVTVYNLGIGGTCASMDDRQKWISPSEYDTPSLVGIAAALSGQADPENIFAGYDTVAATFEQIDPAEVDYYVIEYGINDYFTGTANYNNDDPNDMSYFVNAIHTSLSWISGASPDAKIILSTPVFAEFYNSAGVFIGDGNTVDKGAGTLSDYAASIQNIAGEFDLIYQDAFWDDMYDLSSYTVNDYLMSDGVHLTERGRRTYAAVTSFLLNRDLDRESGAVPHYEIEDF